MRLRRTMEMGLTAGGAAVLVLVSGWFSNPPGLAASPAGAGPSHETPVDAFYRLDTDADGVLSPGEARESSVLKGRFGDADANRDGSIDRSEFAAYELLREDTGPEAPETAPLNDSGAIPGRQDSRDGPNGGAGAPDSRSLEQEFQAADRDGDGNLSLSEFSAFRTAPAAAGEPEAGQEGRAVISPRRSQAFEQIDRNGDGVIDYGEAAAVPVLHDGFGDADTDLNAEIDQAEFSAFVLDRSADPPELPGRFGQPITELPTRPE